MQNIRINNCSLIIFCNSFQTLGQYYKTFTTAVSKLVRLFRFVKVTTSVKPTSMLRYGIITAL
jgi:CobQ-like glutamine amidotransferase family enzyme